MITYLFGLPGSGKTTHVVSECIKYNKKIIKPSPIPFLRSKYKRVLTNVRGLKLPFPSDQIEVYYFDNEDFGVYDMSDSLILFDEATLKFDSRDFAKLPRAARDFLMLHRHYHCDIYFYNQLYHGIDLKIRELTRATYQLRRNVLTGKVTLRKIQYDIYFPRKSKLKDLKRIEVNNGEPKETYYRVSFLEQFFSNLFRFRKLKLKKYYKYFDSFLAPPMPFKQYEKVGSFYDDSSSNISMGSSSC